MSGGNIFNWTNRVMLTGILEKKPYYGTSGWGKSARFSLNQPDINRKTGNKINKYINMQCFNVPFVEQLEKLEYKVLLCVVCRVSIGRNGMYLQVISIEHITPYLGGKEPLEENDYNGN